MRGREKGAPQMGRKKFVTYGRVVYSQSPACLALINVWAPVQIRIWEKIQRTNKFKERTFCGEGGVKVKMRFDYTVNILQLHKVRPCSTLGGTPDADRRSH